MNLILDIVSLLSQKERETAKTECFVSERKVFCFGNHN